MTARSIDPLPKVWDPDTAIGDMLKGKKGLVGVANEQSIAYGCAVKLHAFGAELAVTWLNEKAEPYVRPLAEQLQASITGPLDVQKPGELEALFERIAKEWGRLDFVIHAIAFAPKEDLHGRVVDCSWEGFAEAMQVSCWSFIRMVKLAEPLMRDGGVLCTMSYYGAITARTRW
jgi:enoyl-[acyl-carrier protein] reductase I